MKEKPLPIFPTDEMSDVERLNVQKELLGSYKPASTENLSHFCDCCSNLCTLLGAMVMENSAYRGLESPVALFFKYQHLLDNIRHFNHVNLDMVASQYVSIYPDFQLEMNDDLLKLDRAIVEFMAIPLHTNPEVLEQLLAEDDFSIEMDYFKSDLQSQYRDTIIKVLPEVVHQVVEELEQLLMKNQEKHVKCRSLRDNKELCEIYNAGNSRYMAEEFQKQCLKEESYIAQCMQDTGKTRYEVIQGRYAQCSNDFVNSPEGIMYYSHINDPIGLVLDMMHQGAKKEGFDNIYRCINLLEHYTNEMRLSDQETYALSKGEGELFEVQFCSKEKGILVEKNLSMVAKYMKEKKAKPMDWVCFYQALIFYKYIKPVDFTIFALWLNEKLGHEVISNGRARQIKQSYWVEHAGVAWIKEQAMETNNSLQMASKFKNYSLMVFEINTRLRNS